MSWEVRIQYANGNEKVLHTCKNRETAISYVDAIYSQGYPLHLAYFVHPVLETQTSEPA